MINLTHQSWLGMTHMEKTHLVGETFYEIFGNRDDIMRGTDKAFHGFI